VRINSVFAGALIVCVGACAEVAPTPRDGSSSSDTGVVTDSGVMTDTGVVTDSGVLTDAGAGGARVVINEIRADGEDWIELVNVGSAPADLGGWGVTDSANDGDARVTMAARFPAGTTLAPAGYLLLVADQADAGTGVQMRCLMSGGPMTCFHGGFGISASNGESVHLIDAAGRVVESANYPMNAAMTGESWGRLPNGVGAFARNRLTPGAENQAP
jgi:Lamin Tail Domain